MGSKILCFYTWTYSLSISLSTLHLCPSQIARMPPRCPPFSVPCQCLESLPSCKSLSFGTCLLVPLLPPCGDLLPTPSASFCEVSFPPSLPPLRAPGCMWRGGGAETLRDAPTLAPSPLSLDSGAPVAPSLHQALPPAQNAFPLPSGFTDPTLFSVLIHDSFINHIFPLLPNIKEGMVNFFKHSNTESRKLLMPSSKITKVAIFCDISSPVSSYMPLLTFALLNGDFPRPFS